ncbi:hypothetical protein [Marinobacter alexandrii]|uniref:hypothetical protein n=1 Tax=Marinobacter alexandrii TaxID=2570351 RepID=UPI0032644AE4
MKKARYRSDLQRPVTVRFSADAYAELSSEAEDLGVTIAEVLRRAWSAYQAKTRFEFQISELETRFIRKIFEINVAVCGLDESERREALDQARELIARAKV